jgi:hypothetical protein
MASPHMRKTGIFIALSALLMPAGCFFDASGIGGDGDPSRDAAPGPDTIGEPDAPPSGIEDVIHVPAAAEFGGETDLVLRDGDVIDTGALTINSEAAPAGTVFDTSPQDDPAGPELAILHVRNLEVEQGAIVRVTGSRPLVILAAGTVVIDGTLDAAARRDTPGPGGAAPGQGSGKGGDGEQRGDYRDSGGGGAGHGTAGGKGGDAQCSGGNCAPLAQGGPGGEPYGEATVNVLQGGSGGGAASPTCAPAAGAGGGAVQIYAAVSIKIAAGGGVNVGGGGGGRGILCPDNLSSGSGGGSGGVIFLQSRMIEHAGIMAANGGGGGGSAGRRDGTNEPGTDGADGQLSTAAAPGGSGGGTIYGFAGGKGGAAGSAPEDGVTAPPNYGNGGGGGAAVGYIVLATSGALTGNGQSSPAATPTQY